MKICTTAILLAVLISLQAMRNLEPTADKEELFSFALTSIVRNFYVKQCNNIFVTGSKADTMHDSILQKMFATFDRDISITWIMHDEEYLNGNIDRVGSIVLVDSYKSFRLILESITTTSFDYHGYYTILLTKSDFDRNQSSTLANIFRDFWHNDVLNVNVLTYSEARSSVLLYTYFPFASSHCGKTLPVIWNSFEVDRFVETDKHIFPSKTDNLHECPVSILVAPFAPYVYITGNNSDATYNFEGIEYDLLKELSNSMNVKLNISIHWDLSLGEIYENGTGVGAFGKILSKHYDLIIGALVYGPRLGRILSSSQAYSYDKIVLVVPNSRPYSSFETLFLPFTPTIWVVILAMLGIAVALIKLLQCSDRVHYTFVVGSKNASPYFNLFSVLFTGIAFYQPKSCFARFLLFVWIFACLVLQAVYQGQLFNLIKMNKMMPSISNINELIEAGISIKLIEDNYAYMFTFDQRLAKLLKFVDPNSKWEYATDTEAYVTFEAELAYETQRKHSERIFEPKPKTITISTNAHVMYSSKRFYLKESLDYAIMYLNENGMTFKWNAAYKESAILGYDDSHVPRKLKMSQILGMLKVWFGMLILSTILFLLEVLFPYLGFVINASLKLAPNLEIIEAN